MRHLPYLCRGEVVKGFIRGSKELGIPTTDLRRGSPKTHIDTFKGDFYSEILSIVILGCVRSEKNFTSLETLISTIQEGIEEAKRQLDLPEHFKLKEDNFFHLPECKPQNFRIESWKKKTSPYLHEL